eukprot:SAG31_NODE_490_length_14932_cov_9.350300_3_plen_103_part_00
MWSDLLLELPPPSCVPWQRDTAVVDTRKILERHVAEGNRKTHRVFQRRIKAATVTCSTSLVRIHQFSKSSSVTTPAFEASSLENRLRACHSSIFPICFFTTL